MNKLSKILILSFIFVLHTSLLAQNKLMKLNISPLNRAVFYFANFPEVQTKLSNDKTKVLVAMPNASVSEASNQATGTGIISDISVIQRNNNLEILVSLREKRGYTALKLPYSNSLLIEVFKWESLTQDEDFFRSGLLALENDLTNDAKANFEKAATLKNVNASAMLGILQFSENNYEAALENLNFANKNKTNIPDAYAVLSLIYRQKGDMILANEFEKIFKTMTGLNSISTGVNYTLDSTQNSSEPVSLLEQMSIEQDSVIAVNNDSAYVSKASIDSLKAAQKEKDSDLGSALSFFSNLDLAMIVKGIMYLFAIIAMIYLIKYISKRINQISYQKNNSKLNFKRALRKATGGDDSDEEEEIEPEDKKTQLQTKIKKQKPAANPPKQSGKFVEAKKEKSKVEIVQPDYTQNISSLVSHLKETYHLDPDTMKAPPVIPSPNVMEENNSKQVEEFLNQYLASINTNIPEEKLAPKPKPKANTPKKKAKPKVIDDNSIEGIERKADAKVELALNLAKKQQQLKQWNIENLKAREIPSDQDKLNEFAARLGVETNSLETRKNIEGLEKDEESMSKLAEKFKLNKDKNE